MPYVTLDVRLAKGEPKTCGELNYALTLLMIGYLKRKGLSYQTLNDISGAATESLAEFRRRVIVPYEEKKRKQNGDVY